MICLSRPYGTKYSRKGQVKFAEGSLYKKLKGYDLPKADHTPFKFFKGCLPQILLGPFLNTLSHLLLMLLKNKAVLETVVLGVE